MELRDIISNAPESKNVLIRRLTAENIEHPAKALLESFNSILKRTNVPLNQIPLYTYLKEAEKQGYVEIDNQRVYLISIKPNSDFLKHTSILNDQTIDSLSKYGVYGNPDIESPTYLSTPEWNGESYIEGTEGKNNDKLVVVTVDVKKLLLRRSIFADPESINEEVFRKRVRSPFYNFNELGDIFFICGGIPKEAIREIGPKYTYNKMKTITLI